jgi:vancomycin resistance protein VanJ
MTYTTSNSTTPHRQPRKSSLIVSLLLAAFNLYGIVMCSGLILRLLLGERLLPQNRFTGLFITGDFTPVGLFNSLIPVALLPALLIFPFCLLLRRPRYALLHLPALLVFIINYGGMFLPRDTSIQAADDLPRLKAMSYNVWVGSTNFAPMIEIIQSADADVVAFQELTVDAWDAFETTLGEAYPYQAVYPEQSTSGMGVISRYPIVKQEVWRDGHFQQQVVLEVAGTQIVVFNVHPPIPKLFGVNPTWRDKVLGDVLIWAADRTEPVVLMGDFNMGDFSEMYQRVTTDYNDAFRAAGRGLGLSFPDFAHRYAGNPLLVMPPLARLDYIFYSDGLHAIDAWTSHTSGGSDHRPVYAELIFTDRD